VAVGLGGFLNLFVGVEEVLGRSKRLQVAVDDVVDPIRRVSNDAEDVVIRSGGS